MIPQTVAPRLRMNIKSGPWGSLYRRLATAATATRRPREEGTIASVFTTLTNEAEAALPERFVELKRQIWRDDLRQSWQEVLNELGPAVEEIEARGGTIIPKVAYKDLKTGLSAVAVEEIKKRGAVIVTGGVLQSEALKWKQDIKDYAAANAKHVRGFPPNDIQVFEIYNSRSQIRARTHPALLETQKFLLSLWHTSDPSSEISLTTPISYFDRLRIRHPGDSKFTLGPHTDGGSVERWEDPTLRSCFSRILQGGSQWRKHDPFDASPRIHAKQDLYQTPNQCTVFRPWQGWTALSSTSAGEGTLRVLPMLSLATAYVMLRPFFRPRLLASPASLDPADWEPDLDSPGFPGSVIGKTQEAKEHLHPHLQLQRSMVSIPQVQPGDQVYWHCDLVHAVEPQHRGTGDSSVLYIPAVPLTVNNASYLRDQRINFLSGLPPPDFPGGEGELHFTGRGSADDVTSTAAREVLGFEPFHDIQFAAKVNEALRD
ncbi:DUF1479-domain-containing protein [Pleurotus eryngii]|uniref:DUF1479-domain-containing protein n=1 Tax=Pleurotus eryngii TaxID=5323 RepID=A0A9P6DG86_PLEER|nr:DUF1479-domain-containing protein [Pleurotus eryngii]